MSRIPIKYPYNISVSLYGDRFVAEDWVHTFMAFAEGWQERLGVQYTWFEGGYYDNDKPESKVLRYIKRNRKRIEQFLVTKEVSDIGFTAVEKGADQVRDIECAIDLLQPGRSPYTWWPYHHFYFLVVPEVLKPVLQGESPFTFFLSLLREVEEQLMNVCYGLIQPMASEKLAALYFQNISSEHLSQKEEEKLYIWKGSNREFTSKIWGAFWGNVLTDEHLGTHREAILERVRGIVGSENLVEWTPGKYFFTVPVDILDFPVQQARLERYTRQLEELFAEYNLLMTQDIRDVVAERVKVLERGGELPDG